MKHHSSEADEVKKRALTGLQRLHDMVAIERRATTRDDLIVRKKWSEVSDVEPTIVNQGLGEKRSVDRGPKQVTNGLDRKKAEKGLIGPLVDGPELEIDPKNSKIGPTLELKNGLDKEDGLNDGPNKSNIIESVVVVEDCGPTVATEMIEKKNSGEAQSKGEPRAFGKSSWASLFGSSSRNPLIYTPPSTVGEKIVVIPTKEVIE